MDVSEDNDPLESPKALSTASQLALNSSITQNKSDQFIKSPQGKRRRLDISKENYHYSDYINKKERHPMHPIHNHSMLGRLSQIEGNQLLRMLKLSKSIEQKNEEIAQLNTKIMTLKTQKANQEFENFKLDDEYMKWKEQATGIAEDIDELKHHEQDSLQALQDKYELTTKQLAVSHEERLENLKEEVSQEIEKVMNENVYKYQAEKKQLTADLGDASKQIKSQEQDLNRKLIKLKEEHNKRLIQLNSTMDETLAGLNNDICTITDESAIKEQDYQRLEKTVYKDVNEMNSNLNVRLRELKAKFHDKEMKISNIKNQISSLRSTSQQIESSFKEKAKFIDELNLNANDLNNKLVGKEHVRRILHDKLQQLKGNIRVFCRIRPPSSSQANGHNNEPLASLDFTDDDFNDEANQELVISKDALNENTNHGQSSYSLYQSKNNSYKFQFDKIFLPILLNQDIFDELSQLIQSSLDGYNVCVFAYGQTGSGKTHTMSHPDNGMIPLSIKMIFDNIQELKLKNWTYTVEGQFLEIYNETIVDLLSSVNTTKKHEIKHDDTNGKTSVTNITSVTMTNKNHAKVLLEKASKNRSTASTKLNDRSSRSHSIFILKLFGKNSETGDVSEGTLNLIDLAGSERLTNSQAVGDRLKETQAINKSLSCLGDVIYSLGQQQQNGQLQQHIPYRNSKLTYLLKHSLGGNSKTLMFVNISSLSKNFNETVNSLRFATKVNCTKLGTKPNSR